MTASHSGRHRVGFVACAILAAAFYGCGGGGSDGGGGGGGAGGSTPTAQVTNPGQVDTATPTRPSGVASATPTRTGGSAGTPTRTPTRTRTVAPGSTATPAPDNPVIVVPPGANLRSFVRRAPANTTLVLSPGTYAALVLEAGDLQGPITLLGDVEGAYSEFPPADVRLNAGIRDAALELRNVADITIDGLTLAGGNAAALLVVDSPRILVVDCTILKSKAHGAVFERSDDGLFFNNLVYDNAGSGLRVLGSDLWFAINNTIYGNDVHGVFVGASGGRPSSNFVLENNIINRNAPTGITIDARPPSSLSGYFADFNLNSDGYGADTPVGANDINGPGSASDPQFFFPSGGDFRLSATSPAINAGDFDTDPELVPFLTERTTQRDQSLDIEPVDLGYHYLVVPTPTPRP